MKIALTNLNLNPHTKVNLRDIPINQEINSFLNTSKDRINLIENSTRDKTGAVMEKKSIKGSKEEKDLNGVPHLEIQDIKKNIKTIDIVMIDTVMIETTIGEMTENKLEDNIEERIEETDIKAIKIEEKRIHTKINLTLDQIIKAQTNILKLGNSTKILNTIDLETISIKNNLSQTIRRLLIPPN